MGCLILFSPYLAAGVVALLLWPVNTALALLCSIIAWYAVAIIVGRRMGGGSGDDRYDVHGGPFEI